MTIFFSSYPVWNPDEKVKYQLQSNKTAPDMINVNYLIESDAFCQAPYCDLFMWF